MTMKDTEKVKTPTLDKMRGVKEDSQKLGEFIEWMTENGYHIAEIHEHKGSDDADEPTGCWGVHECTSLCYCGSAKRPHESGVKGCSCRSVVQQNCGYHEGEYYGARLTIEKLLAKYFEIDLDKCEKERQALLDAIQKPEGK